MNIDSLAYRNAQMMCKLLDLPAKGKTKLQRQRLREHFLSSLKPSAALSINKSKESQASHMPSFCATSFPEEAPITVTPATSPTASDGMATTTLKVKVGRSLPTLIAKIIAVNESPGSNGRVMSAKGGGAIGDRVEGVAGAVEAITIAMIKPAFVAEGIEAVGDRVEGVVVTIKAVTIATIKPAFVAEGCEAIGTMSKESPAPLKPSQL